MNSKDDKVVGLLEKVLDRLGSLEDRLYQKAGVKVFQELEEGVSRLEKDVKEQVDELKERITESEVKIVQQEVKEETENMATKGSVEEAKDIESRRNNVIIYKVKEIESEVSDERRARDMFVICA